MCSFFARKNLITSDHSRGMFLTRNGPRHFCMGDDAPVQIVSFPHTSPMRAERKRHDDPTETTVACASDAQALCHRRGSRVLTEHVRTHHPPHDQGQEV